MAVIKIGYPKISDEIRNFIKSETSIDIASIAPPFKLGGDFFLLTSDGDRCSLTSEEHKYEMICPMYLFESGQYKFYLKKYPDLIESELNSLIANQSENNFSTFMSIKPIEDEQFDHFGPLIDSLSLDMQSALKYIALDDGLLSNRASIDNGLIVVNSYGCSSVFYHEVAHLITKDRAGLICEWSAIRKLSHKEVTILLKLRRKEGAVLSGETQKRLFRNGLVSFRAMANEGEDISETVKIVYTQPEIYKKLLSISPRFGEKLEFLNKHGYIRSDQYDYIKGKTDKLPHVFANDQKNCSEHYIEKN
jgi:hypothetical protein